MTQSRPAATVAPDDLLIRAAVLSFFDIDWLYPHPSDDEADRVVDFLFSSCQRVVDPGGTPRWQLKDDERVRVLREVPRPSLLEALSSVPTRPHDPLQAALDVYLNGTLRPVDQLNAAELSATLQLERWVGQQPGLPDAAEVQARLDRVSLLEPLRRLLARGFVGRQDLLDELRSFIASKDTRQPGIFLIEGVGGGGKSTVLAQLVLHLLAPDDLAVYLSLDRGWLIDGGSWAAYDEIVRQVGAGDPRRRDDATRLRLTAQEQAQQASGSLEIASRASQRREPVGPALLMKLGELTAGRRLVVAIDTLEELARRESSFAFEMFSFLGDLARTLPQARLVAAGRSVPTATSALPGRLWRLRGLGENDALTLLRKLTAKTPASEELLREIVRLLNGNPLSLHLAADVLNRTGEDPTQLIAVTEGNIQGQLYSRLLEHIRDPQVRAIAHPGLVVRRLTPDIIRQVLAEPCGIAPLGEDQAARIFRALGEEATLCEPSPDRDGALVQRQDVRTLMLPAIEQDSPGMTRAIHEAAVGYYEDVQAGPAGPANRVARREELYHRLMLGQDRDTLDQRWDPAVASDLEAAEVMDELPSRSQLYLNIKMPWLKLEPEVRAEADDDEWRQSVRPSAIRQMERGQVSAALDLVRERRGGDGRPLLPDLEIEALERLGRVQEALQLARQEQQRATLLGHVGQLRELVAQEARILERLRRWPEAWALLDGLASLDRSRRARTDALDDQVRVRELVTLTSMLRICRNESRAVGPLRSFVMKVLNVIIPVLPPRLGEVMTSVLHSLWPRRAPARPVEELIAETVKLAEATPPRLLRANPSLLRDLAGEIGSRSPQVLQLAASALATPADADADGSSKHSLQEVRSAPAGPSAQEVRGLSAELRATSDASQGYVRGLGSLLSRLTSIRIGRSGTVVVTVENTEPTSQGVPYTHELSASAASGAPLAAVAASIFGVALVAVLAWLAYANWVNPSVIRFDAGYVPYIAVVFIAAGLERLLEPFSQLIIPTSYAKSIAADLMSNARQAGADPSAPAEYVQTLLEQAARAQAHADSLRATRAFVFWMIATDAGLLISGLFGFFLLQSVSVGHVNSLLDLLVTGLAIGAGTKLLHDMITRIQARSSRDT